MKRILWFKEIHKENIALVGGKGANLGEMFNIGLPIPNGFCITAQAYKEFIDVKGLSGKIKEILKKIDVNDTKDLQEKANEIQKLIYYSEIPKEIREEILEAYETLCLDNDIKADEVIKPKEVFVAVRSSATAEDLPTASFAGQQATFLNVKGKELIDAVKKCWASLFTARAIYYRAVIVKRF